jgi:hypothetical protein
MRMRRFSAIAGIVLALAMADKAYGQKPLESEVFLELRTANGYSQFQIGEAIRLKLIFTTSSPRKYKVNKATYDRSGRLGIDHFVVSPSVGWTDPLEIYYQSQEWFDIGGLFNEDELNRKPVVVEDTLNEWVRFDKPGEYVVKAESSRAHHKTGNDLSGPTLESNPITLKIVDADQTWQEKTFAMAVRDFDRELRISKSYMEDSQRKRIAVETLGFLGTVEAAEKLASSIRDTDLDGNLMFALVGTPRKDEALKKMRALLEDPEFPVTYTFLSAMALMELNPKAETKLSAQREQLEAAHRQELKKYVDKKIGDARSTTQRTIDGR